MLAVRWTTNSLSILTRVSLLSSRCAVRGHDETGLIKNFSSLVRSSSEKKILYATNSSLIALAGRRLESTVPKPSGVGGKGAKKSINLIGWKSFCVAALFGTALYLYMIKLKKDKEEATKKARKQAVGKMAIGGPFELLDPNGKLVKSSDFLGKWMLIYFGFTHCPDICPEEMDKMCRVVDIIDKVKIKDQTLQPIFITVDPDRDDYKTVGKYVKDFSSKLIGLSGSRNQIEQVTKAYRVYYSAGPQDEDKDYIVDHTVIMYLVDPEGNFTDYYGQNKKAEEIATAVAIHMNSFEIGSKKKE